MAAITWVELARPLELVGRLSWASAYSHRWIAPTGYALVESPGWFRLP